jgi:hypothetical protein
MVVLSSPPSTLRLGRSLSFRLSIYPRAPAFLGVSMYRSDTCFLYLVFLILTRLGGGKGENAGFSLISSNGKALIFPGYRISLAPCVVNSTVFS